MDHPEVFRLNRARQLKTLQVPEDPQVLKLDDTKHLNRKGKMAACIAVRIRALSNRAPTAKTAKENTHKNPQLPEEPQTLKLL